MPTKAVVMGDSTPRAPIRTAGGGLAVAGAGRTWRMRAMFITWLTLIAAGLVFYSVIGLGHH
jgi:hypothetical protein